MADVVLDNLQVKMTLEDDGYSMAVMRNGQITQQFTRTLSDTQRQLGQTEAAHQSLARTFRQVMVTIAAMRFAVMDFNDVVLGMPRNIIKVSGELERMMKLMEGLSTATTDAGRKMEAQKGFDYILNLAQNAPFKINSLTDAFIKLKSAGLDPMGGVMSALTDSVAKFGGDSETMHRAAIALQQMAGKGVVSMEELRQQLGEAVPDAIQVFARASGMGIAEFVQHVSKGEVEATAAIRRWAAVASFESQGASQKMMETWTGTVSQIQTQFMILAKTAGDAGFFDEVKRQAQGLLSFLRSNDGINFARNIGQGLAETARVIADLVENIRKYGDAIITVLKIVGEAWLANKIVSVAANSEMAGAIKSQLAVQKAAAAEKTAIMLKDLEQQRTNTAAAIVTAEQETNAKLASLQRYEAGYNMLMGKLRAEQARNAILEAKDSGLVAASNAKIAALDAQIAKNVELRASIQARIATEVEEIVVQRTQLASTVATTAAINAQGVALGFATRAAGFFKVAFNAMGGWIGLITNALILGYMAWQEWGSKGKDAIKKVQDQINAGTATRETQSTNDSGIAELEQKLKDAQDRLRVLQGPNRKYAKQSTIDSLTKEIQGYEDQLQAARGRAQEIAKQVAQSDFEDGKRAAEDAFEKRNQAYLSILRDKNATLQQKKAEIDEDTSLSADARNKKQAALQKEMLQNDRDAADMAHKEALTELAGYQKQLKDLTDAKVDATSKEYKRLQGMIAGAQEKVLATAKQTAGLADAGKLTTVASKKQKPAYEEHHDDPLNLALQRAHDDLAAAQDQLKDIEDGAISFDSLYQKALAKVELARKAGHLNDRKTGADGKPVVIDRSDYNKDPNPAQTREIEEQIANEEARTAAFVKNGRVRQQVASETITVNDALEQAEQRLARGGDGINSSFDRVSVTLDKYRRGVVDIDGELKRFDDTAANLKFKAATADLDNFISELTAKNEELRASSFTNEQDRGRYELDAYKDMLAKKYNAERDHLQQAAEQRRKAITDEYGDNDQAAQMLLELDAGLRDKLAALDDKYYEHLDAKQAEFLRKNRTGFEKMLDDWKDMLKQMDDEKQKWANDFVDTIVTMTTTGKADWKSMVESWLADILRMQLKKNLADPLQNIFDMIFQNLSKLLNFGGGGGGGKLFGPNAIDVGDNFAGDMPFYAKGGIMSSMGDIPLEKYAKGGVATRPQLALFGEGRKPEAYVPLPDGRTIPVTVTGGTQGAPVNPPSVTVNVINQTSNNVQAEQKPPRFDGKQMVLDIVLSEVSRPGSFRDGMRQAVRS